MVFKNSSSSKGLSASSSGQLISANRSSEDVVQGDSSLQVSKSLEADRAMTQIFAFAELAELEFLIRVTLMENAILFRRSWNVELRNELFRM